MLYRLFFGAKKAYLACHNLLCRRLRAFTLSELLMSVLVVSIILVAMAPVITKRTNDNISVTSVKTQGVLFTMGTGAGESCNAAYINMDNLGLEGFNGSQSCEFHVPNNVYSINAILQAPGGAGADARLGEVETVTKVFTSDTDFEIPAGENISNIKVLYMSGGGGGGSAPNVQALSGEPQSQEDCEPYNAYFADKSLSGLSKNYCITRRNAGDENGPEIPSTVSKVSTNCYYENKGNCCFSYTGAISLKNQSMCGKGSLADSYLTGYPGANYDSCNRTGCQYDAAVSVCNLWQPEGMAQGLWHIPTENEFKGILKAGPSGDTMAVSPTVAYRELGFCTDLEYSYSRYCISNQADTYGGGKAYIHTTADNSTVRPYRLTYSHIPSLIWVQAQTLSGGETNYIGYGTWGGGLTYLKISNLAGQVQGSQDRYLSKWEIDTFGGFTKEYPLGTRCVTNDLGNRYKVNSGGGGGAAAFYKDYTATAASSVINIYENATGSAGQTWSRKGYIKVRIGKGGKGGTTSTSPTAGTASSLEIYTIDTDDNAERHYVSLKTAGGKAATNATTSTVGKGGVQVNTCYIRDPWNYSPSSGSGTQNPAWKVGTCSGYGPKGEDGNKLAKLTTEKTALGGNGGGSMYNLSDYGAGGLGGSTTDPNGGTITAEDSFGAGGGGGTVAFDSDNNLVIGKGGDGKDGVVVIQYDKVQMGYVGGGGGGGGMVIAKNIKTGPGCVYMVSLRSAIGNNWSTDKYGTYITSYGYSESFDYGEEENERWYNNSDNCNGEYDIYAGAGANGGAYTGRIYTPGSLLCNRKPMLFGCHGETAEDLIGSLGHKGIGGEGGDGKTDSVPDGVIGSIQIKKGENGSAMSSRLNCNGVQAPGSATENNDAYCMGIGGGGGGKSASGSLGGCGGSNESSDGISDMSYGCAKESAGLGTRGNTAPFVRPGDPSAGDYGQAGAGGGGGGWTIFGAEQQEAGAGARGQNGYIYIWWTKVE